VTEADFLNIFARANLELALLVLAVLIIRKPFAHLFGSSATYALWLLPVLGFCLPRLIVTVKPKSVPAEIMAPFTDYADFEVFSPSEHSAASESAVVPNAAVDAASGLPWLLMIYVGIGLLWLLLQLILYRKAYRREFLGSASANPALRQILLGVCQRVGLGAAPDLRISTRHSHALCLGLLTPMVILPKSISEDFSETEINHILTHELMHFRRMDIWTGFGILVFRAVNWINPMVHIGAYYARMDMEAACDASVLKIDSPDHDNPDRDYRGGYLQTLLKSVKLNSLRKDLT